MVAVRKGKEQIIKSTLIKLLRGFIFFDEKKYWEALILNQEYVRNYFQTIGLYLYLNQEDGYAFLKSLPPEREKIDTDLDASEEIGDDQDASSDNISVIRKMPLTFDVTVLLVMLREALEQFDERVSDDYRLILSKSDIYEMLKGFYLERNDETKLIKRFDATINKVKDLGLLKELKNNQDNYEVKRVIKAFFDASKLVEIKKSMQKHVAVTIIN